MHINLLRYGDDIDDPSLPPITIKVINRDVLRCLEPSEQQELMESQHQAVRPGQAGGSPAGLAGELTLPAHDSR